MNCLLYSGAHIVIQETNMSLFILRFYYLKRLAIVATTTTE